MSQVEEKIKVHNCLRICNQKLAAGDIISQAQAWQTVIIFCKQNGMPKRRPNDSGIERVIRFINNKINAANRAKKKPKKLKR